jgi:aminoglycoside 6'-N-acetyltransferase I
VLIAACTSADIDDWARLRAVLWPEEDIGQLRADCPALLARSEDRIAFIAREAERAIGFAEASLRRDYVNGCETSPVGFLEGIYVEPDCRRQGVARALVEAVKRWTLERGCSELGSDALLENEASHRMHEALGFQETERVVYFRQVLKKPGLKP